MLYVITPTRPELLEESYDDDAGYARSALEAGAQLAWLPRESNAEDWDEAIEALPTLAHPTPALWKSTIPSEEYYRKVYQTLRQKNLFLLNDPEEHLSIFEFDRAYPLLADLTPKTIVLTDPTQAEDAAQSLGLPVFVKGALLSYKHMRWSDCIAESPEKLAELTQRLLKNSYFSRGRVLARALAPLRKCVVGSSDIPAAREYRVFLYQGQPLAYGFYWPYLLPFSQLDEKEEQIVLSLAQQAAKRLQAPLVSLDIAQCDDLSWIIIETGDPQFSGTSLMPEQMFWKNLLHHVELSPIKRILQEKNTALAKE